MWDFSNHKYCHNSVQAIFSSKYILVSDFYLRICLTMNK